MKIRYRGKGTGLRLDDHPDCGPITGPVLDCGQSTVGDKAFHIFIMDEEGNNAALSLTRDETLLLIEAAAQALLPEP